MEDQKTPTRICLSVEEIEGRLRYAENILIQTWILCMFNKGKRARRNLLELIGPDLQRVNTLREVLFMGPFDVAHYAEREIRENPGKYDYLRK